jgi:hypothetical protein
MAKGQPLSNHQRGIVNRYYQNRDTIALNTVGEIVSELYLVESAKKRDQLWSRASKALDNLVKEERLDRKRVDRVVDAKDVEGLAELVRKAGQA